MNDDRKMTVHFNNGSKLEFTFPTQIRNSTAAVLEGIKKMMDSDQVIIEGVGWRNAGAPVQGRRARQLLSDGCRMTSIVRAGALGLLVMLSGLGCSKSAAPANDLPAAPVATNSPVAISTNLSFQPLVGRWVRPDGGYVLEIKSAAADGKLEAGYFNPNPIHVGKAEATAEAGTLKVFIELRDVNYPGSTYTLTLDPSGNQLNGDYFQATAQEHYPIYFERMK